MTAEDVTARRRIVVVEPESFWVSELRRRFQDEPTDIQLVLAANVQREVIAAPPDIVVLDAGRLRDIDLDRIGRLARGFPGGALVVILGAGAGNGVEWSLREVGAATVVDELIGGERLAAICRRYLECQTGPGVGPTPSPPESVS